MIFDFYSKKIKVFVSEVSDNMLSLKNHLIKVLSRAGMEVLYLKEIDNIEQITDESKKMLDAADCSVHLISSELISKSKRINNFSILEHHLNEARKKIKTTNSDFKVFIWHPEQQNQMPENEEDDFFISSLRQGIIQNMIFSNRESVVLFVEDIRSVMYGGKSVEYKTEKTDLFFIYNWIDQDYANDIISLVSDVVETKKLEIVLSEDVDYAELVAQQIKKSRVAVIYFKNTADWALPFVQQVWKKTGGASSSTPIIFIGDANIDSNVKIDFDAPKVISLIVPHEIMPVEIKVQYDRLTQ